MSGDINESVRIMRATYGSDRGASTEPPVVYDEWTATSTSDYADELRVPAPTAAEHFTDLGNAERLVQAHGRDLRFAPGIGWLAWDGRRWRRDDDGEVMRRAKRTVRSLYRLAEDIDDKKTRDRLIAHAQKSESEARLRAAVSLAETERPVIVEPKQLDADAMLFSSANGTVDLRTGELRPHRREDLITRIANASYEPGARSDVWDSTLERVTGGDSELASFLQRATGYTLTGHTSEDKLFFAHGPGATGKSTVLEAIRQALGEYATTADFSTFLKKRNDAGPRNDVARLAGARLVISLEVDEGKALAEGLIKSLTGGDTVAARYLFRETFEFVPAFKLWLAANARPRVNAEDDAMWRRIVQMPFVHVIPEAERDERIKIKLKHDPEVQRAILAWAVEGCLAWQRDGLKVPESVRDYTAEYRNENDPLRDWLSDECQLDGDWITPSADLFKSYELHTVANGEKPVSSKAFANLLKAKGCESVRPSGIRSWKGITLTRSQ